MEDAFIGRKAVALRIERLESEMRTTGAEIAAWTPIGSQLAKQKGRDALFTQFFVQSTVQQRRADHQRGLEIAAEVERIDGELSRLDLFWLNDQRRQIEALKQEIDALDGEKTKHTEEKARLRECVRRLDYEELPELCSQQTEKEDALNEQFTQTFLEQLGLPRYRQEFARLKRASAVAKNFRDQLARTQNERSGTQSRIVQGPTGLRQRIPALLLPC